MSWQEELQKGTRTAAELAGVLGLSPEEEARYAEIIARYPIDDHPVLFVSGGFVGPG
jgi:hypothetical protein